MTLYVCVEDINLIKPEILSNQISRPHKSGVVTHLPASDRYVITSDYRISYGET